MRGSVTYLPVRKLRGGMTQQREALAPYGDWLRRNGLSDNTIRQRVEFAARIATDLPPDPSDTDLMSLLAPYTGWTKTTYHGHLSSWYDWQVVIGARPMNPLKAPEHKRPPAPRPMPKPLRRPEEAAILAGAVGDLRVWLLLGLREGLRCHEIAKLRAEDVTADWVYVAGKGGKYDRVPTSPEIWEIARGMPQTGYWFPSASAKSGHISTDKIQRSVRNLFDSLGLAGNIHRCRATFGTTLLRNGATIEAVRRLMRHSSLSSTQHYVDAEGDELRAAIMGLGAA